jgi:hypothetical protein
MDPPFAHTAQKNQMKYIYHVEISNGFWRIKELEKTFK